MIRTRLLAILLLSFLLCLLLSNGCELQGKIQSYPSDEAISFTADESKPRTFEGVSQVVAFNDYIISGAKPVGRAGFESLMKMNVDTIICVDGVVPDVKTAREFGIKTFHIPLKYDSPNASKIFDLTTIASRKMRGNIYIHCHQGKHRSAAAAAIVSISLGTLTIDEAKKRMDVSQTSKAYKGLWIAVEQTKVIDVFDLLRNKKIYPSRVEPEGMTSQMIAIDEAMDNLIRVQNEHWNAPKDHPDLVGVAEAGIIANTFRKIHLSKEANSLPVDFETQLVNALHQASGLEEALLQNLPNSELDVYMKRVKQSCINCHSAFRK